MQEDAPAYVELRAIRVRAMTERVFERVCRSGGVEGWYATNPAWRLRGAMDRLVGGPGLRAKVPRRALPEVGDALDFWRVVRVEAPSDLVLEAEMKIPGRARLGFHVRAGGAGESLLFQRVEFLPRGVAGKLYWWLLYPAHRFVFRRMLRNLAFRLQAQPG